MPNWCYNDMDVMGDRDELQRFVDETKTTDEKGNVYFSLNHLFPIPEELANTTSGFFGDPEEQAKQTAKEEANRAKFGYKDWYDWACDPKNWGTKWGTCDFEWTSLDDKYTVAEGETLITAYYETAWSPADGLIRNISAKFPTLTFSVVSTEESDAFAGYAIYRNGDTLADDGEEPEYPKHLSELMENNEDEYYEQLNDWQNDTKEKWSNAADEALSKYLEASK